VPASGGGPGALLVSPFNVKWRFSVQAGGVEGSKFCLFSVVFPVRCISSVSPRFYFRRHAFCFLPLAAILESPLYTLVSRLQKQKAKLNPYMVACNFIGYFIPLVLRDLLHVSIL
jgi:hypothetical protein